MAKNKSKTKTAIYHPPKKGDALSRGDSLS